MALNIIYFFIILVYGIWLLAIIIKDNIIAVISSLLMFPLAIYIFINGIDTFANNELLVIMFAAVTFMLAVITSFQATYNMYSNI